MHQGPSLVSSYIAGAAPWVFFLPPAAQLGFGALILASDYLAGKPVNPFAFLYFIPGAFQLRRFLLTQRASRIVESVLRGNPNFMSLCLQKSSAVADDIFKMCARKNLSSQELKAVLSDIKKLEKTLHEDLNNLHKSLTAQALKNLNLSQQEIAAIRYLLKHDRARFEGLIVDHFERRFLDRLSASELNPAQMAKIQKQFKKTVKKVRTKRKLRRKKVKKAGKTQGRRPTNSRSTSPSFSQVRESEQPSSLKQHAISVGSGGPPDTNRQGYTKAHSMIPEAKKRSQEEALSFLVGREVLKKEGVFGKWRR